MKRIVTPGTALFLPWFLPVFLLGCWCFAGWSPRVPEYLVPSPERVVESLYLYVFGEPGSGPYAGRCLGDLTASFVRVALGFGLAVSLGLPLGVLSGRCRVVQGFLGTTVDGIRSVPGISWLPLAMVWFGVGVGTTVFLVALAAFFPIYLNTASAVRSVPPVLVQAGAMMGVGPLERLWSILLPAAMPQIMSGLRLGLGTSWAYLVLGELTGVSRGVGALIMDARMLGRIDIIVMGILIIAVIGRLSDLLLVTCMRGRFRSARRLL